MGSKIRFWADVGLMCRGLPSFIGGVIKESIFAEENSLFGIFLNSVGEEHADISLAIQGNAQLAIDLALPGSERLALGIENLQRTAIVGGNTVDGADVSLCVADQVVCIHVPGGEQRPLFVKSLNSGWKPVNNVYPAGAVQGNLLRPAEITRGSILV